MSTALVRQTPEAVEHQLKLVKASSFLPKAYKEHPADLEVAAWTLHSLDIPVNAQTIKMTYVIDNSCELMAQLQIALAMRAGFVLELVDEETNVNQAVVLVRTVSEPAEKPDGSRNGRRVTFTWEDALRSQKVHFYEKRVDSGRKYPKSEDPIMKVMRWVPGLPEGSPGAEKPAWVTDDLPLVVFNERYLTHSTDMLAARACTRAIKRHCPGVKLGIGVPVFLPSDSAVWEGPVMVDPARAPLELPEPKGFDAVGFYSVTAALAEELGCDAILLAERLVMMATGDRTDDAHEIRSEEVLALRALYRAAATGALKVLDDAKPETATEGPGSDEGLFGEQS